MADGAVHRVVRVGKQRRSLRLTALQEFLKLEASGGIILVGMMLIAMALVNTPLAPFYEAFLELPVEVRVGPLDIAKPMLLWINDGLMVIFFALVSLEIKRELMQGELSSVRQAALPMIGAAGGMAAPALIYVWYSAGDPLAMRGWAIPSATDIAFSLGVLALLGSRVPVSLKVFLAALAIIDDLGAILIIAVFYTGNLSWISLGLAVGGTLLLVALNRAGVRRITPYTLTAVFLWVCVLKSGVHATLAGVALGFALPLTEDENGQSPLKRFEHSLNPWVAYAILPLFALANSGLSFQGMSLDALTHPVVLGTAAGLFIGKQLGVFSTTWLAIRMGWGRLPQGATWAEFYGVCVLTGIGFTMSLFIGSLAFEAGRLEAEMRLGVVLGSVMSAVVGYSILRVLSARRAAPAEHTVTVEPEEEHHARQTHRSVG